MMPGWPRAQENRLVVGGAYSHRHVNHSTTSQSFASVISCMWKRAVSSFLGVCYSALWCSIIIIIIMDKKSINNIEHLWGSALSAPGLLDSSLESHAYTYACWIFPPCLVFFPPFKTLASELALIEDCFYALIGCLWRFLGRGASWETSSRSHSLSFHPFSTLFILLDLCHPLWFASKL